MNVVEVVKRTFFCIQKKIAKNFVNFVRKHERLTWHRRLENSTNGIPKRKVELSEQNQRKADFKRGSGDLGMDFAFLLFICPYTFPITALEYNKQQFSRISMRNDIPNPQVQRED